MIETEQLAWVVLRTVNRRQAKGSTARLVVPSDPEVASELGMDPDEDRLQTAVEYLLERGYIVPADIDLRRGTFAITPMGLKWLDKIPPEPLGASESVAGELERSEKKPRLATGGTQEGVERPWWRRMFGQAVRRPLSAAAVFAAVLVLAVGGVRLFFPATEQRPQQEAHDGQEQPQDQEQQEQPEPPTIPGLSSAEVRLALENQGLDCNGPSIGENLMKWTCVGVYGGAELEVQMQGASPTSIRSVKAMVAGPSTDDALAADFLGYVSTVPYEDGAPEVARSWVEANVGAVGAEVRRERTIGSARFELYGPPATRTLEITTSEPPR
jgi:hypothetical protein